MAADFDAVFAALRALMLAETPGMRPLKDVAGNLEMLAAIPHPRDPKKPMMFGMVRQGKAYVSYHLMPLYMSPAMQAKIPPALKARMQGKTCFNFKTADPALMADLAALTRACAKAFSQPLKL